MQGQEAEESESASFNQEGANSAVPAQGPASAKKSAKKKGSAASAAVGDVSDEDANTPRVAKAKRSVKKARTDKNTADSSEDKRSVKIKKSSKNSTFPTESGSTKSACVDGRPRPPEGADYPQGNEPEKSTSLGEAPAWLKISHGVQGKGEASDLPDQTVSEESPRSAFGEAMEEYGSTFNEEEETAWGESRTIDNQGASMESALSRTAVSESAQYGTCFGKTASLGGPTEATVADEFSLKSTNLSGAMDEEGEIPHMTQHSEAKGGTTMQNGKSVAFGKRDPTLANQRFQPNLFQSSRVILHIYDLGVAGSSKIHWNAVLHPLGAGAYHLAVEVYGEEWSYGYVDSQRGTGIFHCEPTKCLGHQYRQALTLGETPVSPPDFQRMVKSLQDEWLGKDYDVVHRNCIKFCSELSKRLQVSRLPAWVKRLGNTGDKLRKFAPVGLKANSRKTKPKATAKGSPKASPRNSPRGSPAGSPRDITALWSTQASQGSHGSQGVLSWTGNIFGQASSVASAGVLGVQRFLPCRTRPEPTGALAAPNMGGECSGWMEKRGPMAGWKWHRVWCVMGSSSLVYWTDETCKIKKGEVKLSQASHAHRFQEPGACGDAFQYARDRPYGFVLDVDPSAGKNRHLFYFDALDELAVQRWLHSCVITVERLKTKWKH